MSNKTTKSPGTCIKRILIQRFPLSIRKTIPGSIRLTISTQNKNSFSLANGSAKFLDKKHLRLSKLGRISFNKSQRTILNKSFLIRIEEL